MGTSLWNFLGDLLTEVRDVFLPRHIIVTPMVRYVRFRTPVFRNFFKRWILFWRDDRPERILEQEEPIALEPGVYFYWGLVTEMELQIVNRQAIPLEPQSIITKDGKQMTVQTLIVYRISDPKTVVVETYHPDETIGEIALKAAPSVAAHFDYETIRKSALQVDENENMEELIERLDKGEQLEMTPVTKLLTAITRSCLNNYGVDVEYCNLIQITETRAYRLFTGSANPNSSIVH